MTTMIYHVYRTDEVGYDEAAGFVVIADNPLEARSFAAMQAGDEGRDRWHRTDSVKVDWLGTAKPHATAGIVLRDWLAG